MARYYPPCPKHFSNVKAPAPLAGAEALLQEILTIFYKVIDSRVATHCKDDLLCGQIAAIKNFLAKNSGWAPFRCKHPAMIPYWKQEVDRRIRKIKYLLPISALNQPSQIRNSNRQMPSVVSWGILLPLIERLSQELGRLCHEIAFFELYHNIILLHYLRKQLIICETLLDQILSRSPATISSTVMCS